MRRLTKRLPALLFAGAIAIVGAACEADGTTDDPGLVDPAEDPLAPTDEATTP